jgi:FkbM family methyltransferase
MITGRGFFAVLGVLGMLALGRIYITMGLGGAVPVSVLPPAPVLAVSVPPPAPVPAVSVPPPASVPAVSVLPPAPPPAPVPAVSVLPPAQPSAVPPTSAPVLSTGIAGSPGPASPPPAPGSQGGGSIAAETFKQRQQATITRGLTPIPMTADAACGAKNIGGGHGWPVCPKLVSTKTDCVVYAIGIGKFPEFDEILARKHGCEVHSFDPSPTGRDAIAKLRDSGKMPSNMHYHELGISDFDGDLTLYGSQTGVMFTRECTERNIDVAAGRTCADAAVTFPVKTVKTVMQELGHTHLTMLKIDTEGGEELAVMDWSLTGVLSQVDAVCAEFHYYSAFGYDGNADKPTVIWDGPNGVYAPGVSEQRKFRKVSQDKVGNWMNHFANKPTMPPKKMWYSPELEVVSELLHEAGLKSYTNGFVNTRCYLGATLAEACWGR